MYRFTTTKTRLERIEFMEKYFVLFRFDVKMECEKINENVKNEPPAKINNSCHKIKTRVAASCNVYFITHLIFILQPL